MAEESARTNNFTKIKTDLAQMVTKDPKKTIFFITKIVEVIFCIIAIGLSDYPFNDLKIRRNFFNNFTDIEGAIVFTSLYGFTLINAILILSHVLGDQLPKKMLMIFSGAGVLLCCIAGVILIVELNNHENDIIPSEYLDQLLPSGIFAILASLTFAIDTFLTYKYT